jgi:tetratricopeptide (TPR) repeat protein
MLCRTFSLVLLISLGAVSASHAQAAEYNNQKLGFLAVPTRTAAPSTPAMRIVEVYPYGAAWIAQLRPGDILIAVNDVPTYRLREMETTIATGRSVTFRFERNGKQLVTEAPIVPPPEVADEVRRELAKGQRQATEGDLAAAEHTYKKVLSLYPNSSLAHYRLAEVYMFSQMYQDAANELRRALNADLVPEWVEVWAHVQLGKIFDATAQRERARNEYRQALQTNNNTNGALDEARKYYAEPYRPPEKIPQPDGSPKR